MKLKLNESIYFKRFSVAALLLPLCLPMLIYAKTPVGFLNLHGKQDTNKVSLLLQFGPGIGYGWQDKDVFSTWQKHLVWPVIAGGIKIQFKRISLGAGYSFIQYKYKKSNYTNYTYWYLLHCVSLNGNYALGNKKLSPGIALDVGVFRFGTRTKPEDAGQAVSDTKYWIPLGNYKGIPMYASLGINIKRCIEKHLLFYVEPSFSFSHIQYIVYTNIDGYITPHEETVNLFSPAISTGLIINL